MVPKVAENLTDSSFYPRCSESPLGFHLRENITFVAAKTIYFKLYHCVRTQKEQTFSKTKFILRRIAAAYVTMYSELVQKS